MASRATQLPAALARARPPRPVLDVLRRLGEAGHRSWLVGGAVRDLLLRRGRPEADFDVATPATPEQVMALFPRTIPTGVEHGTVTVLIPGKHRKVEVTTFRGEAGYLDGRRPSAVTFHADLDADLARRDLTMNALAWDPPGRAFRDPFGGRGDLRRRLVRAVGDPATRFGEDGLRPLRAVRFAAQLGFALDPATRAAIPAALPVVARVSVERVCEELGKLLSAPHAGRGLALLDETGLLDVAFPALAALPSALRDHGVATGRAVRGDAVSRLAALLHPLWAADPAGGARAARQAVQRLRFPTAIADGVEALVREHGCLLAAGGAPPAATPADLRRRLSRLGPGRAPLLVALRRAEARALPPAARRRAGREAEALARRVTSVLAGRPPLSVADLPLGGAEVMALLGIGPGPAVGEAVRHLLDLSLEEPGRATARDLAAALRAWWAARPPAA